MCSVLEIAKKSEGSRFVRDELGFVSFRCQERANNVEDGSVGYSLPGHESVVHEIAFQRNWKSVASHFHVGLLKEQ